jgi:hypothetical protein
MRRVADYRENAEACRELAKQMPLAHREQLLDMALQWERIAAERETALNAPDFPMPDPAPRK